MSDEIRTSGYHAANGAFISPGLRGNSPSTSNGDYQEWIEYEAEQANLEARRQQSERFEPQQDWTPKDELQVEIDDELDESELD